MAIAMPRVTVVRWPAESELRDALRARAMPRLLIVDEGASPPLDTDSLEDWVIATASTAEIDVRLSTLSARAQPSDPAPPSVDDDDVLRVGDRWLALGPIEANIARVLVRRAGQLVTRDTVQKSAWDGIDVRANTVDRQMHRVRAHFASLGLVLVTVRGRGYVLDVGPRVA